MFQLKHEYQRREIIMAININNNCLYLQSLGCFSLGESENGFVIPDHMDSLSPKKCKIRKRIILT